MIQLYQYLKLKSHLGGLRAHLSRTMLLELYRLGQLHVLHKAIYMSLHRAHLYGSTHSSYILDRFMGAGGGVIPCMYCSRLEWVATAEDSLTSAAPELHRCHTDDTVTISTASLHK